MNQQKATRDSWKKRILMPEAKVRLEVERTFTQEEYERLQLGLIPRQMEDKWFVYCEDGWLFFHRSWTGYCIYHIHLEPGDEGWKISEVWANDDTSQFPLKAREVFYRFLVDYLLGYLATRQSM